MENIKEYSKFIRGKYKQANKIYDILLKDDTPVMTVMIYLETMNIYPVYPMPIITNIKKKEYIFEIKDGDNLGELKKNEKYFNLFKHKQTEFDNYIKQHEATHTGKVRKFFDYEIRDAIKTIIKESYITNAWCKLFELLCVYNVFSDVESNTIKAFHICEHPGAFIYATRDYIKKHYPSKQYDFTFQSLKPEGHGTQIFKSEYNLLKNYGKTNLDYGKTGDGDITKIDNILHYKNKYGNVGYDIITSDCGLDCSDDYVGQEVDLVKIYFGAFLAAIGMCSKKTIYICKMFSYYHPKTLELLYLYCLFFDNVDIVRALTTKAASGEIYVVCKEYKGKSDDLYEKLVAYYKTYDVNGKNFITYFDHYFINKILMSSKILNMRRAINVNSLIFRDKNDNYVQKNDTIKKYVNGLVSYYTHHFLLLTKLKQEELLYKIE